MKPSSSRISSTPLGDDQSQLELPKSLVFDDSASTSRDLSKTMTQENANKFSLALTKITQNVPPSSCLNQQPMINQTSSTQVNQQQTMSLSGRIPDRKPDVYDGNTGIDEWVDSMKAYAEGTNPGVVMDKVRVSQIKLFMGPNALKDEFCDWNVLKK